MDTKAPRHQEEREEVTVKKLLFLSLSISAILNFSCDKVKKAEIAPSPRKWINVSSDTSAFIQNGKKILDTDYFEVRVTRLMTAVDRLKEKAAIPLTEELAQYYAGPHYRIEKKATHPYLVRGLYANGTGVHSLYWYDERLLICHDSLGHHFEPNFSPLVVNLPEVPKEVYIIIGGAE